MQTTAAVVATTPKRWKGTQWWQFVGGIGNAWFIGCLVWQSGDAVSQRWDIFPLGQLALPLLMGFVAARTWQSLRLTDNQCAGATAILALTTTATYLCFDGGSPGEVPFLFFIAIALLPWFLHLVGCGLARRSTHS